MKVPFLAKVNDELVITNLTEEYDQIQHKIRDMVVSTPGAIIIKASMINVNSGYDYSGEIDYYEVIDDKKLINNYAEFLI